LKQRPIYGLQYTMNILSAIFAGQTGFLRATQSMAERASRVASPGASDDQMAADLVGMKVDKAFAEANTRTVKVADNLLSEFVRNSLKK
jgi:hypothetical protein